VTRAEALRAGAARLAAAGIDGAAREARLLMRWAANLDAAALATALDAPMGAAEAARWAEGLAARAGRAPLSHVTGRRRFWGRDFAVTPDVLDPRPETETLVAWALEGPPAARVLDLGVGSGCILLTLLAEWPDARGLGVDASQAALAVAARNAVALGVSDRSTLRGGDWLDGVDARFDLVVANPPYLSDADMERLAPEARAEPAQALHGGPDGLDGYRRIAAGLAAALKPGGVALFEVGAGQADAVSAILRAGGAATVETRADLDGRARVLRARMGVAERI
jgi:release factor glutamine methyltransferase